MIYALTQKDVEWIGNAAAVIGGGVTAWDESDNGHMLPMWIKDATGREYLGTMPGIDIPLVCEPEWVNNLIRKCEEDIKEMERDDYYVSKRDVFIDPLKDRANQIKKFLSYDSE